MDNIYGREVINQEAGSQISKLDLNIHPKGIYIIKLTTNNQSIIKKIIKQ